MTDEEESRCFFPACGVERIANVVLLHCSTDDDAIVAFEIFKEIAIGKPVWIGKADDES